MWDEPGPISSAMIALSLIIAGVASDLGLEIQRMMEREGTSREWALYEAIAAAIPEGTTSWGIGALRRWISEMYGAKGKVRQVADCLLGLLVNIKDDSIGMSPPLRTAFETAVEACLTFPTTAQQIESLQTVMESFKDSCDTTRITQLINELQRKKRGEE